MYVIGLVKRGFHIHPVGQIWHAITYLVEELLTWNFHSNVLQLVKMFCETFKCLAHAYTPEVISHQSCNICVEDPFLQIQSHIIQLPVFYFAWHCPFLQPQAIIVWHNTFTKANGIAILLSMNRNFLVVYFSSCPLHLRTYLKDGY